MNNLTGNMGINLSNEIDVVANSFSVIQGNEIKNIFNVIYTETEIDQLFLATRTLIDTSTPFYIAGKVSTTGGVLSSKGRIGFTSYKSSAGVYVITPNTAFGDTNYIVNISCQYAGSVGSYSVFTNSLTSTGFTVITMNNSTYQDAIFHFTVLN